MLIATFFTCGLLLQIGAQYIAAGNTRACVEIRSVLAEAPQVVPARRRMSETLDVTVPATSSMSTNMSSSRLASLSPKKTKLSDYSIVRSLPMRCSASAMFGSSNVDSCQARIRRSIRIVCDVDWMYRLM